MFVKHFNGNNNVNDSETKPEENMAGSFDLNYEWIVDLGATDNITCQNKLFKNITTGVNEAPITIPNGDVIPVKGKGELLLREAIMLKGVLFAPNLKCNLLSVHRLTKDLHCAITFFPDFFVIQVLESRSLIGVGRCSEGLYRLKGIKDERKEMVVTADIWHKRLGHASNMKLSRVNSLRNISFDSENKTCDSCFKAKFARLPFPVSSIKTKECFDLIHCDVWGHIEHLPFRG